MTEIPEKFSDGRKVRINIIKSIIAALTGKRSGNALNDFTNTEFKRSVEIWTEVDGEEVREKRLKILLPASGKGRGVVTLVPMKTLSLEDFKFPFSSLIKIRDALKLQVMPYASAGNVELFPVVMSKKGKESDGVVWYVYPEELAFPNGLNVGKVLPAPLPFVSQLKIYNGSGVTMWIDEKNISSLLWQNNRPVLSRWKQNRERNSDKIVDNELAWYDAYCEQKGFDRGGNFIVNASSNEDDISSNPEEERENNYEFLRIVTESFDICPWISNMNLSRLALEGARDLERTVKFLTRVAIILAIAGVISLGGSLLNYLHLGDEISKVRTRSENLYREVFDKEHKGRIANPVALARDRIASVTGTGSTGHGLDEVLENLGSIFTDDESLRNITIDIIRYNSEGLDCTGSAPDMTTILNFRKAWENIAAHVQLDNTQSVSGIGYRFDLRVRW